MLQHFQEVLVNEFQYPLMDRDGEMHPGRALAPRRHDDVCALSLPALLAGHGGTMQESISDFNWPHGIGNLECQQIRSPNGLWVNSVTTESFARDPEDFKQS